MKNLCICFMTLLVTFCGIWVYKTKTPINRPDDAEVIIDDTPWWEISDTPRADPKWILDPEIPENYIPMPGMEETYMVIDQETGEIKKYRQRTQQADGSWSWTDVDPNMNGTTIEAVEGLEDIYKVTDEDGNEEYFEYIRNPDDSFAYVPVDKEGNSLADKEAAKDSSVIPDNYIRVNGNIYAVYNEHGIFIGYKERKYDENTKEYYWVDVEGAGLELPDIPRPTYPNNDGFGKDPSVTIPTPTTDNPPDSKPTDPPETTPGEQETKPSEPKTYTETETITSKETRGDWVYTYETIITRVYDEHGELLSTKKDGPREIKKEKLAEGGNDAPDASKIKGTLKEEYARVSVGMVYQGELAANVVAVINTERVAAGLPALSVDNSSNKYLLAAVRAADMAYYNHSDYDSPMYGTINEMADRFSVGCPNVELIWKTSSGKTAEEIASRLQIMGGDSFMSPNLSTVALAIISRGGYFYIDFCMS